MSENDVRDGLREAVAGEPPLDFDPDALVDTARRQVRHRALLSVGVATVAVVAAAVVVPLTVSGGGVPVGDQPSVTGQVEPERPTVAPEDFEWPPPGTKSVTYMAAELRQRAKEMRTSLQEALPALLPEATDVTVGLFGGESEGAVADHQNYLNAFATFTVDGARYGIAVNVYAPGMTDQTPAQVCESAVCLQQGAVGDGYVVTTSADAGEGRIVSAHHYRASGALVFVSGYNYDPTSPTGPVYHPSMPVGAELLRQLATDTRFDL